MKPSASFYELCDLSKDSSGRCRANMTKSYVTVAGAAMDLTGRCDYCITLNDHTSRLTCADWFINNPQAPETVGAS